MADLAVAAHRLLGLRDVSRTDAIVAARRDRRTSSRSNSSPGLTETSLLPMAIEAAGRSLGDIYAGLIERAVASTGTLGSRSMLLFAIVTVT